jgi:glycogen debranching enzyme
MIHLLKRQSIPLFIVMMLCSCGEPSKQLQSESLLSVVSSTPHLIGKKEYLNSPFVTAGDRVYMVGHQDGSFPDLGWHISGEMGGVWDHPIKLMDGFDVSISSGGATHCLQKADSFINYPFANKHHFDWREQNLQIERFQFSPDGEEGLVVEFTIRNYSTEKKVLSLAARFNFDLRPTWLGERTGMKNDVDEVGFRDKEQVLVAKDRSNPWFAVVGSSVPARGSSLDFTGCAGSVGKESTGGSIRYEIEVDPNSFSIVPIFISGSYRSESDAMKTFSRLQDHSVELLRNKIARYDSIRNTAKISVPDSAIQQMLEWTKYTTDWLVREVPEQGRGLSAGTPDYPWWFGCDNEYSLQGALATGRHDLAKSTILLLKKISDKTNGNGRIIHEASTNGSVYNPGNTNETAQFIMLLWTYYQWTGDREFIKELYTDVIKGLDWLLKEKDPDGNLFPNGPGMTEIHGLDSEMIDVSVYTQQALEAAAKLSASLGETQNQKEFDEKASNLKKKINEVWWVDADNSFADFISTRDKAIGLVKAAIIRADTLKKTAAVNELKARLKRLESSSDKASKGYIVYHNAVVNSPMEVGIADPDKAKRALETAHKYRNYFGAYVVGIDMSDDVDSVVARARQKTFNYTGAVMTLSTGILAIAEARYGNSDEALEYLKRLGHTYSYSLPGSMYEVSPDFGMMAQAWNIYAVETPVISHFFGVTPDAGNKTIYLRPNLPSEWKRASVSNLIVGDNHVSISIERYSENAKVVTYTIEQTNADWTIVLPLENELVVGLNNEPFKRSPGRNKTFRLQGKKKFIVTIKKLK